jgi:hypothetical protein
MEPSDYEFGFVAMFEEWRRFEHSARALDQGWVLST